MKIISWNVNGVRAIMGKDFAKKLAEMNPDILCLQETKAQDDQTKEALKSFFEYKIYTNSAVRKGYSGTAILTKTEPLSVSYDIGVEEHDQEGRVICAEFDNFYLVTVYVPNSGGELLRLDYRTKWDADFLVYLKNLETKKPVLVCGDLNVAHKDVDLARPKENYNKSAGFMQAEIDGIDNFVNAGLKDTFRELNPTTTDKYTWWSYRAGAKQRNIGWRIDYFLSSKALLPNVAEAFIYDHIEGSDHCPVGVVMK